MKCWRFKTHDVPLEKVLAWAFFGAEADRILFATQLESKGNKKLVPVGVKDNVTKIFGYHVIESFSASGWPGTDLIGQKGRVWIAEFNENVMASILTTQPNLGLWLNNRSLPEDLCAFKQGSQYPAFVSVTHERNAWLFNNTKPAVPGLQEDRPLLRGFLFPGKHFCKL